MDWNPIPFQIVELDSDDQLTKIIQENNSNMPPHTFFFLKKYVQFPKVIELGDAGEYNPYHFYFMMLARFRFVDDGKTKILYYYPNKRNCYLSEQGLKLLPDRFERVTEKMPGIYYFELPYLIWFDEYLGDPWIPTYIRELYKDIWNSSPQIKGKYSYISRNKYGRRRVLNESTVMEKLRFLGFSFYNMEDLTLQDQIRLFSSSEVLCGIHSAAFANLIFCGPDSKCIEIFSDNKTHLHYVDISVKCNIKYLRYSNTKIVSAESEDIEILDSEHFLTEIKKFIQ